jgi:hypothetical protein
MQENDIKKIIQEELAKYSYKNDSFTARKLTDTPTDDLSVVNRKYINLYGSVSGRPQNSIIGQQYFATDLGYPIFRNSNNAWVSGTGSVVG